MTADQTTEIAASASALHRPNGSRRIRRDQIIFWLGIAYVFTAPPAIGLFTTSASIAWLSLLAGAFVSLLAKFDTIAEFSLGPIKATMRETLAEAAAILTQLRQLATGTR